MNNTEEKKRIVISISFGNGGSLAAQKAGDEPSNDNWLGNLFAILKKITKIYEATTCKTAIISS